MERSTFTTPAFIIGLSIVIVGIFGYSAANNFADRDNVLTVTGSAERLVKSDTAKWTITVKRRTAQTAGAALVNKDAEAVKTYLKSKGISDDAIRVNPPSTNELCVSNSSGYPDCGLGVSGYDNYQTLEVNSNDVDQIASLANTLAADIPAVNITSQYVEYYFNGLKDIRIDLLNEATANAKARAEGITKASGADLGALVSASSGVFQVTAVNSVDVSDYGTYDTSAIQKKVTATIRASFRAD
jgi:hypothetical protein